MTGKTTVNRKINLNNVVHYRALTENVENYNDANKYNFKISNNLKKIVYNFYYLQKLIIKTSA